MAFIPPPDSYEVRKKRSRVTAINSAANISSLQEALDLLHTGLPELCDVPIEFLWLTLTRFIRLLSEIVIESLWWNFGERDFVLPAR
jgi:hypothetical protein